MHKCNGCEPALRVRLPLVSGRLAHSVLSVALLASPRLRGADDGAPLAALGGGRLGLPRFGPLVSCRDGHPNQLLDIADQRDLLGIAQRDGDAVRSCPGGAADPVNVGLWDV